MDVKEKNAEVINNNLFIEKVKFYRTKSYDPTTTIQYWSCSFYKTNGCKAHAKTTYITISEGSAGVMHKDPWNFPQLYKLKVISCDNLLEHAKAHHVSS